MTKHLIAVFLETVIVHHPLLHWIHGPVNDISLKAHKYEYITKTCKYRLPVFLNSINNNSENSDILRNIIDEINNITLVKFKSVTKRYMINKYSYYCNIRNCCICQL